METEVGQLKKRNYQRIRELMRISFSLGVNLTSPSPFKDSLKILNVILTVTTIISLYGHWNYTMRNINDLKKISESMSMGLQAMVAIPKMIHLLFSQRQFHVLLDQAQSHEIIIKSELFKKDYFIIKKLKNIITHILEVNWKNIRRQLIFYICAICIITSNYIFPSFLMNTYHAVKQTPNYKPRWPFLVVCAQWDDKGMTLPYYEIQMYLSTCSLYVTSFCAATFDGVFIVLCVHAVGLIQALNVMIENSTSHEVPKERRVEYLRDCIRTYQRIREYVFTLNKLYRQVSLSQFLMSLFIWGSLLFQMSISVDSNKATFVRMILFILPASYEILIYCNNSQRLTNESEKIPLAFYNCKWYEESAEFKQLIRMMILRTNYAFELNISWFSTMSLATFLAMVKTSGSYFLLLRNLSE